MNKPAASTASRSSAVGHRQPLPWPANAIATILETSVIERILENLGLPVRAPPRATARVSMSQAA
jgi:hypothetical protein